MTQERAHTKPSAPRPRAKVPVRPRLAAKAASPNARIQQFVTTQPAPCPYLPRQTEQKLVTALDPANPEAYAALHGAGFRRSHEMAYRPVCPNCNACKSLRIDVEAFRPNRTQRKLLRRNAALRRIVSEQGPTQEGYDLFHAYTAARHHDGEMAQMGPSDYASLVLESSVDTHLIEWHCPDSRTDASLVAACITDILPDGLSMVYSYFDPSEPRASYGTLMVLSLMEVCQRLQLPYLYLGYWVAGSATMDYKANFDAAEAYGDQGWQKIARAM